jgi:PAS domain S-box-containing protein
MFLWKGVSASGNNFGNGMSKILIKKLGQLKPFHILLIAVVLSEIFTAVLNSINSILWWNRIDLDLLIIGSIDALFVSTVVTRILVPILKYTLNLEEITMQLQDEIGKRIRTEEALKKSREQIRLLLDSTAEAIYGVDMHGDCTFVNSACCRILGYEDDRGLLGKNMHELIHYKHQDGSDYPKEKCRIYATFREGRESHVTNEVFLRSDGSSFPVEYRSYPIKDKESVIGAVVTFLDISERRITERKLRESEERYHTLFDNANDMIQSVSSDGHFIFVNPSWLRTMNYTWEELQGITIFDLLHPDCRLHCDAAFRRVMSGEAITNVEAIFLTKDGKQVIVEGNVSPRFIRGSVVGSQGIFHNITARRKAEEEQEKLRSQLIQAQKMEAVGQLAGGIAHDFNNILTVITTYGHLLKMSLKDGEALQSYTNHILESSEKAANLVKSLLAFSRTQIMNPMPVTLNAIINNMQKFLTRVIGEDIEFATVLSEEDLRVLADRYQIEQALMNLVTNAKDAMPEGGQLTIKTESAMIEDTFIRTHGYGKEGKYGVISVTDTGIGMNEQTQQKIFEPFFTTKQVGQGTGLGLSMLYGIIKQHAGYIEVISNVKKGTTFRIYLPLIESEAGETKPDSRNVPQGGHETILLAEDSKAVRESTKAILEEFGYSVIEAIDGEDAVQKFSANRDEIQLLLFDVIMPKQNGKDAYEEIKKVKTDIRVLFLSGYPTNAINKKGIIGEGLPLLLKPVSPSALLDKIREVLQPK